MFSGLGAIVSEHVPREAIALLQSQGAVLLSDIPPSLGGAVERPRGVDDHKHHQQQSVNLFIVGVVSDRGSYQEELKEHHRQLKARRIPIVRSAWVLSHVARQSVVTVPPADECARSVAWLPMRHPLAIYDPNLFQGMVFTTSGLVPASVKANTIALMVFLGAVYTTCDCDAIATRSCAASGSIATTAVTQRRRCPRRWPLR